MSPQVPSVPTPLRPLCEVPVSLTMGQPSPCPAWTWETPLHFTPIAVCLSPPGTAYPSQPLPSRDCTAPRPLPSRDCTPFLASVALARHLPGGRRPPSLTFGSPGQAGGGREGGLQRTADPAPATSRALWEYKSLPAPWGKPGLAQFGFCQEGLKQEGGSQDRCYHWAAWVPQLHNRPHFRTHHESLP